MRSTLCTRACDTPREVADAVELVFTSIPDDVALDPTGFSPGLSPERPGWTSVRSARAPAAGVAERVRERGAVMLDAPVSGSIPQVQAGTLTIMVGGDENAYDRVEPVPRELGTPTRIGGNGQGLISSSINISLAVQMLAFSEGLLLAERDGVDRGVAVEAMDRGADRLADAEGTCSARARSP